MKIAVLGTGYVGLVTGACFSGIGHKVSCYDIDEVKINALQSGDLPIYEPHLHDLVRKNRDAGRLFFTKILEDAVEPSEVIFICVGTPPLEDGDVDLTSVEMVSREIARASHSYKLVVEKSTVPVQTGSWVEKTIKLYGPKGIEFDVASNPEFLREGSAVEDFLHPDRIVIGVQNHRTEEILRELYAPITGRTFNCPIHQDCRRDEGAVPFIVTSISSAELIKHASNSFLATKISFINAVANICERTGANIKDVSYGIGLDRRIGKSFLEAGIGFGGFCFPKDLQAFIRISEKCGYDFRLLKEVERINHERIFEVVEKIKGCLWVLKGKTVAILGLAFKPNTDDVRFASALEIAKRLIKEGASIRAYDPKAMEKARRVMPEIFYCSDVYEAVRGADAMLVCTGWEEFAELDFELVRGLMGRPFIFDGRNFYDRSKMTDLGFEYVGIGVEG